MTAAFTILPVFGVPCPSRALSGQDSLLFHRPDAGRHPRRHARHRRGGRGQRRAARRRPCWRSPTLRFPSDCKRGAQTRPGATRWRTFRRMDRGADDSDARRDSRHSRRRPARPHARHGGAQDRPIAATSMRPRTTAPAYDAAHDSTIAALRGRGGAAAFRGGRAIVVTFEFENVPTATLEFLETLPARAPERKGARAHAGPADREDFPARSRAGDRPVRRRARRRGARPRAPCATSGDPRS